MPNLLEPWPWYIAGPLIGLTVPAMLLVTGKTLGISASFRHICAAVLPKTNLAYFKNYAWRKEIWNLIFVAGLLLGGFIATRFLSANPQPLLPATYHNWAGALQLMGGGILIGFGTRYAEGCTSGHSIMGLSNLQKSSLIATLAFFVGGLTASFIHRIFGLGG
jgi:uncharacterized protein